MPTREQALQTLHYSLINGERAIAIALLADVLTQQGLVQASALFEQAKGVEIAPDIWTAAIAQIQTSPEGTVIQNVLQSQHHCHLMGVYPDQDEPLPPFTYSIGLWYNFQHPEIICIGLPSPVAGSLINTYAQEVAQGHPPPLDTAITDALANDYQLQFKLCDDRAKIEYTCWASWFNGSITYPVVQLIWQDQQYRWPWEANFYPSQAQPLLIDSNLL